MSLSKLPRSFGLENDVVKGYFPHRYNTEDNKDFEGSIPEMEYFDPEGMSESDKEEVPNLV